jgi:hypothetical protein
MKKFKENDIVKLPNDINTYKEGTVGSKFLENLGYGIFIRYEENNKICIVKTKKENEFSFNLKIPTDILNACQ